MASAVVTKIYEEVVRDLPREEQQELAETIRERLSSSEAPTTVKWRDIRGMAPPQSMGEDAQDWVSRTRRENDETVAPTDQRPRRTWKEIQAMPPYPPREEDAQDWVSRTRRECDEHREQSVRGVR